MTTITITYTTSVYTPAGWRSETVTALAKLIVFPQLPLVPSASSLDSQDERQSILAGITLLLIFTGGLGWALAQVFLTLL